MVQLRVKTNPDPQNLLQNQPGPLEFRTERGNILLGLRNIWVRSDPRHRTSVSLTQEVEAGGILRWDRLDQQLHPGTVLEVLVQTEERLGDIDEENQSSEEDKLLKHQKESSASCWISASLSNFFQVFVSRRIFLHLLNLEQFVPQTRRNLRGILRRSC